jgi:hypothetical protein
MFYNILINIYNIIYSNCLNLFKNNTDFYKYKNMIFYRTIIKLEDDLKKDISIIKNDLISLNNEKISLGMKQLTKNPWDVLDENINTGSIVKGKVIELYLEIIDINCMPHI